MKRHNAVALEELRRLRDVDDRFEGEPEVASGPLARVLYTDGKGLVGVARVRKRGEVPTDEN